MHEPVGTASTQSQRDMGTKELHGWTSGHPLELAPSTMSSVLPGRGCALEMVLVAASLSCPMEALLEAEQGVYFYPGIGVFIASSCCSDEHCRNTLWKVLPVCWSPSGLHMHAHTCMGVDTCTPPPGYPFPALQSPTLLEKCHGAVIRATMVLQGQPLLKVYSGLGVGLAGISN